MKTMYPPGFGYHHNGFVATHALGHMMYRCAQVYELPQGHFGDNREGHCCHDYTHPPTHTHTHTHTHVYTHRDNFSEN